MIEKIDMLMYGLFGGILGFALAMAWKLTKDVIRRL